MKLNHELALNAIEAIGVGTALNDQMADIVGVRTIGKKKRVR